MTLAQRDAPELQVEEAAAVVSRIDAALGPLLERAAATGSDTTTLVSVAVPVDRLDPVALFGAAHALGHEPSLWLRPDEDLALLGIGCARDVRADGASRFDDVDETWRSLLEGALIEAPPGTRGVGPLLIGGFGFDAEPAVSATWRGFERASLRLPALLLTGTPTGTWLTLNVLVEPGDAAGEESARSLGQTWAGLIDEVGRPSVRTPPTMLRPTAYRPEPAEWQATVARFAGAVGRGRLDKVVLSRQVDVVAESLIDVATILARLRDSAPASIVFAATRAGRTFLGASPERLVRLDGRELSTVAMAGSTRRGVDGVEDAALATALLDSDKEREEHAVVVEMLRRTLLPLTERLLIPDAPTVVRLAHVQHLVSAIDGRLRDDLGILAILARLHPTPAVGGAPLELALELIAEEERHERGWYAGPFGWLDRRRDGEFAVALRSGLVEGPMATLFAGCGIVADSDPEREWAESRVKLQALGSALGLVEP